MSLITQKGMQGINPPHPSRDTAGRPACLPGRQTSREGTFETMTSLFRQAFLVIFFSFVAGTFQTLPCSGAAAAPGAEPEISINADSLDYTAETGQYVAAGSVKVTRLDAVMHADQATYDEKTTDTVATGNVRYEDNEVSITASRADLKMGSKTGKLYDAVVFFKKSNTHIQGKELEKRGDQEYYSPEASFTTCDAPLPAWCFKGKEVNARLGERFTARSATFSIKGLPVFYSPYLWASLSADRQTGFLMPVAGYSRVNGLEFKLPFYWAISENRDMTLLLDSYSKRGLGLGLEYRFLEPSGRHGDLWLYQIRDTKRDQDYSEANASYEARGEGGWGGYLTVNYASKADYYREFSIQREIRTQRFLESTGEFSISVPGGRAYLLSQYWVDLKDPTGDVPQRLPELGYVLDYVPFGGMLLGGSASATNVWRENGLSARRLDVFPRVTYAFGSDVVVSQTAAFRGTAYSYYRNPGGDDDLFRAAMAYNAQVHTRLSRQYGSLTHIIEPSLGYRFIDASRDDLAVFDSTETFQRASVVELGLLNRGIAAGRELVITRLTQALDTRGGNRAFLPLHLEAALKAPLSLQIDAAYDHYSRNISAVTSNVAFRAFGADFAIGQMFRRQDDIMVYTANTSFSPARGMSLAGQVWYDAKGGGVRDLTVNFRYQMQCWGFKVEAVKRPGDFTMRFMVELKGLKPDLPKTQGPADAKTYF